MNETQRKEIEMIKMHAQLLSKTRIRSKLKRMHEGGERDVRACYTTIYVHICNKLASRHVRVGLGNPSQVPHCDICENAPAFFYCEIDGTSLCLECDMIVHVGGKRSHGRYLLLRQRIQFPGDKEGNTKDVTMQSKEQTDARNDQNCIASKPMICENFSYANGDVSGKIDAKMIDLNTIPYRNLGQASFSRGLILEAEKKDN